MNGNCRKQSVVYQSTVSTEGVLPSQTYVGLTGNYFKTTKPFISNSHKRHSTELRNLVFERQLDKV